MEQHRDPGLQAERTTLAWVRTSMTVAVVGALFVRFHLAALVWLDALAAAGLLVAGVVSVVASEVRRSRARRRPGDGRTIPALLPLSLTAGLTITSVAMLAALWS